MMNHAMRKSSLLPSGVLVFACLLLGSHFHSGTRADADEPTSDVVATPAVGAHKGMSPEKPAEGPSVKVEEGYMVPYTERIPGTDIEFEMIPIPGGTYKLGSPESDPDRKEDETPQVEITVDPMWVAKTEVTWAEYDQYMNLYTLFKEFEAKKIRVVDANDRVDVITAPTELYMPDHTYEYGKEPNEPAITMTQYAAKQYTKWLSAVTERQYRLPTEAEWEYACRAGTTTRFSWGDDESEIDDYAWYVDNTDWEGPAAVGTKKPNPFGLHDFHGNVAEWTVDAWTEDGYVDFEGKNLNALEAVHWPENPYPCVVRGGSWEMDPVDLRSAARLPSDDEYWKEEDPNYPKSPWWFTSDPARGVGFRVFRSYKPLTREKMHNFWEAITEHQLADIESRLIEGRGGLGRVDKDLPAAIEKMKDER